MNKPKVSIILIHYNTPEYLKSCIDSILAQTYPNIDLLFIDNASPTNEGIRLVKENYDTEIRQNKLRIIENPKNTGYSAAANQGIELTINDSRYIAITNPDLIYEKDYFEKCLSRLESATQTASHNQAQQKISSITGKVLKYDFQNRKKTSLIDTTGLLKDKSNRIVDRGQGETDHGQYEQEEYIFGVSGACPVYRAEALKDAKIYSEYFDEDFFMYKEDCDLAWRLQLYGWKSLYLPAAIAWHGRGTAAVQRRSLLQIVNNRSQLSRFQKKLSFRNQKLMELKNLLPEKIVVKNSKHPQLKNSVPARLKRKILTCLFIIFREPFLLKELGSFLKMRTKMLQKREIILRTISKQMAES